MTGKHLRRASLAAALIVSFAASLASAGQGAKFDVSGTWAFDVQTDAGGGSPTLVFKQEGEKLTGHYSGSTLGEAELTGTVKGAQIDFGFTASVQGNQLPVTFKGTLDSVTSMKGTLEITGLGTGTFAGKKK
jgi:hypothetical protein